MAYEKRTRKEGNEGKKARRWLHTGGVFVCSKCENMVENLLEILEIVPYKKLLRLLLLRHDGVTEKRERRQSKAIRPPACVPNLKKKKK